MKDSNCGFEIYIGVTFEACITKICHQTFVNTLLHNGNVLQILLCGCSAARDAVDGVKMRGRDNMAKDICMKKKLLEAIRK